MSLSQFFTFDPTNFVNGQARLLFSKLGNGALTDAAVPTDISKVFAMESPYAPIALPTTVSPWVDIGATHAPPQYDRNVTENEWKIQQRLTPVLLVPQEIVRTVKIPFAEFARADLLGLFENGPAQTAVAGATDISAQAVQSFGQFTDLLQYRVAVAMFQPLEAGVVTEAGGGTRPRLLVQTFYRCSVMAENVAVLYGQGDMVSADVTLKCYAEQSQPQNSEYGAYFLEAAGTIA